MANRHLYSPEHVNTLRAEGERLGVKAQRFGYLGCITGCATCRQFRLDVKAAQEREAASKAAPRKADITAADIERRFTYHRPEGRKVADHEDIRSLFKDWASDLADILPAGREKSLAFTALETASFWAHAAIAREGK